MKTEKTLEQLLNETTIPGKYEPRASDLYKLKDLLEIEDGKDAELFLKILMPVYKLGFARGTQYGGSLSKKHG